MTVLTRDEIASYASNAGFTGDNVRIAVAVALAESGGDTNSHNTTPPDNSYGLWQINMFGDLGPARRRDYHLSDNTALFSPAINARVAYGVWKSQGWEKGWTTYSSGKYKQFLDKGMVDSVTSGLKSGIGDVTGVNAIGQAINGFGKTVFNGIASIVGIAVALTLLVVGVLILMRNQSTVKAVRTKVGKVATKSVTSKVLP